MNWTAKTVGNIQSRARGDLRRRGPRSGAPGRGELRPGHHSAGQPGRQHRHRRGYRAGPRVCGRLVGGRDPREHHRPGRLRRPAAHRSRHRRPARAHRHRMGHQLMVPTKLSASPQMSHSAFSAGAVIGLTALGIGLALADPALAGSRHPHATLSGSLADAAGILENNARSLSVPFLLVLLDFAQSRIGRHAGDVIVTSLTAAEHHPGRARAGPLARATAGLPAAAAIRMDSPGARGERLGRRPFRSPHHPPAGAARRSHPDTADQRGLPGALGHPAQTRASSRHSA